MGQENLILTCAIAFAAVMILLGLLAAVIQCIEWVFREKDNPTRIDPAVVAAVNNAVAVRLPGSRVIRMEETTQSQDR